MKKVLTIGYVHLMIREEIDLPRLMQDLEGSIFVDGAYGHGGIEYRARTGETTRTKGEYLNDKRYRICYAACDRQNERARGRHRDDLQRGHLIII